MAWIVLIVILYIPVFYRINTRINALEEKNRLLENTIHELQSKIQS